MVLKLYPTYLVKSMIGLFYLILTTGNVCAKKNENKLSLGFGGGVNTALVITIQPVDLYENLSEDEGVEENYTGLIRNLGNQYFFHVEYSVSHFIFFTTPGTTTINFTKNTPIVGGPEPDPIETRFTPRYFSVPLGAKFFINGEKARPYLGAKATYGQLLNGGGNNNSIITSRFTAGGMLGTYIVLKKFTLDVNLGYNQGLHRITDQASRYTDTGEGLTSLDNILLNDIQFNVSILVPLEKSWHMSSLNCNYPRR